MCTHGMWVRVIDPDIAMEYLTFVAERHRVWEARQAGFPPPWTDDRMLRTYKFTNVYRVLDYGSQFLASELLDPDLSPRDILARCVLYRYTNLPSTWLYVRDQMGGYPVETDLGGSLVDVVKGYREAGNTVFSGAYVILPKPNRKGDKVEQAVDMVSSFMSDHASEFLAATSQQQRFNVLRSHYGIGAFMAMQILTDWGYSTQCGQDLEDEFVVCGPGAIKGARFLDPDGDPYQTLMWAVDAVRMQPDVPLLQVGVNTRPPSWMDVQNCLCEFSKYHRDLAKPPRTKEYLPAHPGPQSPPALPSHW